MHGVSVALTEDTDPMASLKFASPDDRLAAGRLEQKAYTLNVQEI